MYARVGMRPIATFAFHPGRPRLHPWDGPVHHIWFPRREYHTVSSAFLSMDETDKSLPAELGVIPCFVKPWRPRKNPSQLSIKQGPSHTANFSISDKILLHMNERPGKRWPSDRRQRI